MLKEVCVYELMVRLYQKNGSSYTFPFTVHAEDGTKARGVLEKYLTENKEDVGLKYEKVDCIWNTGSKYIVMNVDK